MKNGQAFESFLNEQGFSVLQKQPWLGNAVKLT
jgi:hypothetical protein